MKGLSCLELKEKLEGHIGEIGLYEEIRVFDFKNPHTEKQIILTDDFIHYIVGVAEGKEILHIDLDKIGNFTSYKEKEKEVYNEVISIHIKENNETICIKF